jgi:hypothetical protein
MVWMDAFLEKMLKSDDGVKTGVTMKSDDGVKTGVTMKSDVVSRAHLGTSA